MRFPRSLLAGELPARDPVPAPKGSPDCVPASLCPSSLSSTVTWNDSPLFTFDFPFTQIEKKKANLGWIKTLSVPESGWKNEENNVSFDLKKPNHTLLKC